MTQGLAPSASLDRVPLGLALMIGFCAVGPLIDVAAKMASQHVSVVMVTFGRVVVQAALMAPVVLIVGQTFRLQRALWGLVMVRALMLIGSTLAFVGAVQVMPIADALAIAFIEPFILLALGFLLFQEQVGPRRIAASIVGFCGALMVIQPNFEAFGLVALYPVATAVFFALYMLTTRRLSRDMPTEAMQFHTATFGVLVLAPVVAVGAAFDQPWALIGDAPSVVWGQLFAVGLAATVSHGMISYALRFAPSATLAPLHYLEIVNAVLFGWLFFNDWPNPLSWTGIAVIVGSGLYIIARERVLAREARRAKL